MNERYELVIRDFLLEGRDEEKSHAILEINELPNQTEATKNRLFIVGELIGATPKTIQVVRSWVDYLLQNFPDNATENQFEDLLGSINTQSRLFLKQHPDAIIHLAVVLIQNNSLTLATHGLPGIILFYTKQDIWKTVNLVADQTEVGELFSQVTTGALRPTDRLLLATPRVLEFFTPDRLTKISEGKNMNEVAEHMERVLKEMASDFSFGAVWVALQRVLENEEAAPANPIKKFAGANNSMSDLIKKTRSTASILAPPIIKIPKDKIVTTILRTSYRLFITGGQSLLVASRSLFILLRTRSRVLPPLAAKINVSQSFGRAQNSFQKIITWFKTLPPARKKPIQIGAGVVGCLVVALIIFGIISYRNQQAEINHSALQKISADVQAAQDKFLAQNEAGARAALADAQTAFQAIPSRFQGDEIGQQTAAALAAASQKILRRTSVEPTSIGDIKNLRTLALSKSQPIALNKNNEIIIYRNGAPTTLTKSKDVQTILSDEDHKRLVIIHTNRTLEAVSLVDGTTKSINISWLPENTRLDAAVFYNGRLYVYDGATLMIYRYDASGENYGAGKSWITDAGKPTGGTMLAADSSLWVLTQVGGILKFTGGKFQPFHFSNIEPAIEKITTLWTGGAGTQLYSLEPNKNRLLVTDRDGKLIQQYILPAANNLTTFAIDEKETTVWGLTADGRLVSFALNK